MTRMDLVVAKRAINAIRTVTMVLLMIIFLGYLLIWVMASTNFYRQKWLPKIRAHANNSTYFGTQGANILMYTFPVLFMALLGCVYLYLGKKLTTSIAASNSKDNRLALWKRSMVIKGLGIVTRIELAFFIMFIALLVWSFANYLHFSFSNVTPESAAKDGEKVWEAKLNSAALRLGDVGNICLAFLFFPVTRGSSLLPLLGLTSEASVKYHIWLGHIVMTLFTAHGVCFIVYWAATNQLSQMLEWAKTDIAIVAGEIALLCGLLIWMTTIPRIRRKLFELFFYTHYLYILFIIFYVFHVGISYACIMLPGFYLFLIDRFLRFLQSRRGVRLVSARILPCETVELNFSKSKDLNYTPTSIIFMSVPCISKLQWHPFTVSSSCNLEPEKLSVVIRGEGSWSRKLYQLLSSPSSVEQLDVYTEGPYGPVSTNFLRHDMLVMVSGGSGITPFISTIRELIFMNAALKCKTPQILLISVFKNPTDLTMLDLLLPISSTPSDFSNLSLQINAFVTRDKEPNPQYKSSIRTIWFKPNRSVAPMTPVLGKNGWLWLGAIILSSFIIYLVFMGILTRYYIYPVDQNTNNNYPHTSKAALNMLFIISSIVITSSTTFLWSKQQNAKETKQIQNLEGTTPTASPTSCLYNVDKELESFPQQSLVQLTNVHYGERPNLKKILIERKESSVGVLVCGPRGMRDEVASICQHNPAENLHFECLSFSW